MLTRCAFCNTAFRCIVLSSSVYRNTLNRTSFHQYFRPISYGQQTFKISILATTNLKMVQLS